MKIPNWELIKNDIELRSFNDYLKEMALYLEAQDEKLSKEWESTEKENSDDYKEYLSDQYQAIKRHKEILYFSYIVALWSYLEEELNSIAKVLSRAESVSLKLEEVKGCGCYRAILFLEKVCQLQMPTNELRRRLECINKIRNCFVHNNYRVNWSPEYFNYVATNIEGVTAIAYPHGEGQLISIDKTFCFFSTKVIHEYLETLVKYNHDGPYAYLPVFQ